MFDRKGSGHMAWIKFIEEEEASGKLKKYYKHIKRTRGKIPNILKVQSLNPDAHALNLTDDVFFW